MHADAESEMGSRVVSAAKRGRGDGSTVSGKCIYMYSPVFNQIIQQVGEQNKHILRHAGTLGNLLPKHLSRKKLLENVLQPHEKEI